MGARVYLINWCPIGNWWNGHLGESSAGDLGACPRWCV